MYQHFVQNALLDSYCTYHIGGKAKYLAFVYDSDGLMRALSLCERFVVLGRGSKVLVSDDGFDGTVILMRNSLVSVGDARDGVVLRGEFRKDSVSDLSEGLREDFCEDSSDDVGIGAYGTVYAEAGVALPYLSRWYAMRSFAGLEWACSIPGSVGGALRLNAGAYGGDMSQIVLCVDVLREGRIVRLCGSECGFSYRHSGFYPSDIIVGGLFRALRGDDAEIARLRQENNKKRENAQPKGFSCGSIFRAGDLPAYKYIEECGLKGCCLGGAEISAKHGNFILNKGGAKARDVYNLIRTAKAEVFCRSGVKLFEEVVYIGDF